MKKTGLLFLFVFVHFFVAQAQERTMHYVYADGLWLMPEAENSRE